MAIPNPSPNIADGVKSDVTTYSSNKIESLISAATELPIPAAGDAGKVLTVNAGADGYELDVIPSELPTPAAGDIGKVLTVDSDLGYDLESPVLPHDCIVGTATATADTTQGTLETVHFTGITIPAGYTIAAAADVSVSGELLGAPVNFNDAEGKITFTYFSTATRTGRSLTIKYLLVYVGT